MSLTVTTRPLDPIQVLSTILSDLYNGICRFIRFMICTSDERKEEYRTIARRYPVPVAIERYNNQSTIVSEEYVKYSPESNTYIRKPMSETRDIDRMSYEGYVITKSVIRCARDKTTGTWHPSIPVTQRSWYYDLYGNMIAFAKKISVGYTDELTAYDTLINTDNSIHMIDRETLLSHGTEWFISVTFVSHAMYVTHRSTMGLDMVESDPRVTITYDRGHLED